MNKKIKISVLILGLMVLAVYGFLVLSFYTTMKRLQPILEASPFLSMDRVSIKAYMFSVEFDGLSFYGGLNDSAMKGSTPEEKMRRSGYAMAIQGKTMLRYVPFSRSLSIIFPEKGTATQYYSDGRPLLKTTADFDQITLSAAGLSQSLRLGNVDFLHGFSWSLTKETKNLAILLDGFSRPWITHEALHVGLALKNQQGGENQEIKASYLAQGTVMNQEGVAPSMPLFSYPASLADDLRFKTNGAFDLRMEGKIMPILSAAMGCREQKNSARSVRMLMSVIKGVAPSDIAPYSCDSMPDLLPGLVLDMEQKKDYLGSSHRVTFSFQAPPSMSQGKAEATLALDAMVSKESQQLLSKIIWQLALADNPEKTKVDFSEETVAALLPDFSSMGNIGFRLHLSADMEQLQRDGGGGNAVLTLSSNDCIIKAEIQAANLQNAQASLSLENSDGVVDGLHGYVKKVLEHPALAAEIDPSMKAMFPHHTESIKAFLLGFGQEQVMSDGTKNMVFELPVTKDEIEDLWRMASEFNF